MSDGLVYVIQAGEHVKIGWTTNLGNRIEDLRSGSPHRLDVLGVCPGDRDLERAWHHEFRSERVHGEWFQLSADQLEALCERLEPVEVQFTARGKPLVQCRVSLEMKLAMEATGLSTSEFLRAAVEEKLAHSL